MVFYYLNAIKAYKEGDAFPSQFLTFLEDITMQESLESFIEKERSSIGQSEAELKSKVLQLFNGLSTGNDRDPSEVAL